jgi:hypothetical protein
MTLTWPHRQPHLDSNLRQWPWRLSPSELDYLPKAHVSHCVRKSEDPPVFTRQGLLNHSSAWPWPAVDREMVICRTALSRFESARAVCDRTVGDADREHPHREVYDPPSAKRCSCAVSAQCRVSRGSRGPPPTHQTSVYAQAISDAVDGDYRDGSTLVSRTVLATTEWIGLMVFPNHPGLIHPKISAELSISHSAAATTAYVSVRGQDVC